jgi:hypothetical protein
MVVVVVLVLVLVCVCVCVGGVLISAGLIVEVALLTELRRTQFVLEIFCSGRVAFWQRNTSGGMLATPLPRAT